MVTRSRRIVRRLVLAIASMVAALVLAEFAALAWLHWCASDESFQRYATITELRDRYGDAGRFQAHRHLGYSLTPGYRKSGNRHNRLGFRGDEIDVQRKRPGPRRVVCCGGSTTYGEGVQHDYTLSMPFLLQRSLPPSVVDVEVINAVARVGRPSRR